MWAHFFRVTGLAGNDRKASRFAYVSPGYFDTLKIPILSGRDFHDFDNARSQRVMLVNESFVRSHLGGLNPIGPTLRTIAEAGYPETTYEIIGVVGNTKYADLRKSLAGVRWQQGRCRRLPSCRLHRTPVCSLGTRDRPLQHIVVGNHLHHCAARGEAESGIAIQFTELKSQIRERLLGERMMAWLAGAFGILAIVLVTVGLYGIIAYLAVSRRNEIGIRLSLGSTRAQIAMMVLRRKLWLLATGLAIGLPARRGCDAWRPHAIVRSHANRRPDDGGSHAPARDRGRPRGSIPAWRAARIPPEAALRCD